MLLRVQDETEEHVPQVLLRTVLVEKAKQVFIMYVHVRRCVPILQY